MSRKDAPSECPVCARPMSPRVYVWRTQPNVPTCEPCAKARFSVLEQIKQELLDFHTVDLADWK